MSISRAKVYQGSCDYVITASSQLARIVIHSCTSDVPVIFLLPAMKTDAVKGIILVVLFVLTFMLGLLPLKIVTFARKRSASEPSAIKRIRYKRAISFLNCFAAGVFLATCLLDLLPDVRSDLSSVLIEIDTIANFPVAEFVMTFGLFLILIVEQIVLSIKEGTVQSDVRRPLLESEVGVRQRQISTTSEHSIGGISDESFSQSNSYREPDEQQYSIKHSGHSHSMPYDYEHDHSSLRSLLLLCALSLHSIFEGLAVGLQKNNQGVIGLFAALVLHKGILSFSLGLSLVQSKLSRRTTILSILFFSMTSPIGVGIGIGVTDLGDSFTSSLIQGLLQGVACGTFLYVTFFEIMPHEFNSQDQRLLKLIFLLVGFGTVTGVLFWHISSDKTEINPCILNGD